MTAVAVLGGVGALPSAADQPGTGGRAAISQVAAETTTAPQVATASGIPSPADSHEARTTPAPTPSTRAPNRRGAPTTPAR